MTHLTRITSETQIAELANLAHEIWTEHYPPIIGSEQVDYMVDKFQSEEAITVQIADGYEYYLLAHRDKNVGYIALVPDVGENALMISKLYVVRSGRSSGFGKKMLALAEDICRERGISTLWLTVNKNNVDSIAWYVRRGFRNTGASVQDIGTGFVMDDYRFEKTIEKKA